MALIDNDKAVLPLSSIAELMNAKVRTLKLYEEKMLFPADADGKMKKRYTINDVKSIAFVHYLASVKKINANGIRFILDILNNTLDEEKREEFLHYAEKKMEKLSLSDMNEVDHADFK